MKIKVLSILLASLMIIGTVSAQKWQKITSVEDVCKAYPNEMKKMLGEFNLEYPGLEKVKAAWETENLTEACNQLLEYYKSSNNAGHLRKSQPEKSDRTEAEADTILKDVFVIQNVTGQVPWGGDGHRDWYYKGPNNDKLHISIAAYGRDLLVDAGRFAYTGEVAEKFRPYAQGSQGHNVLLIDGKGQESGPRLAEEQVSKKHWLITDEYDYAWSSNKKGNLQVIPVGNQDWKTTFVEGQKDPEIQGWYSEEYNKYEPNAASIYSTEIESDRKLVWVLFPSEKKEKLVQAEIISESSKEIKVRVISEKNNEWVVTVPL